MNFNLYQIIFLVRKSSYLNVIRLIGNRRFYILPLREQAGTSAEWVLERAQLGAQLLGLAAHRHARAGQGRY